MITPRLALDGAFLWIAAAAAFSLAPAGLAQEPAAEIRDNEPLLFRNFFIPEEQIREMTQGFRAINRQKFEQMLAAINARSASAAAAAGAHIVRATYSARLEQDQLVAGQASLEVVHASETASILSLSPCPFAVSKPQWAGQEATPVDMGTDPSGVLVALVDRSATLQFSWSLRGVRDQRGELSFALALPPCPINQLILELPSDVVPVVDVGFASPLPSDKAVPSATAPPNGAQGQGPDPGPLRWLIELGGNRQATLRVVPKTDDGQRRRLVLLRETTTYSFADSGLEYQARITLDVHREPIQRLVLDVDPSLQVASARFGEKQLFVSQQTQADKSASLVTLDFPEPILGSGREILLTGLSPITLGRMWRLPSLRPKDVLWQQGVATLEIPASLVLEKLVPAGCLETKVEPLPSPSGGESRQLQYYQPQATIDVILASRPTQIQLRGATTLKLSDTVMKARFVGDLTSLYGSRFVLDLERPRSWRIESVETIPADALDASTFPGRRPRIRLRQAVRPGRGVRVVITAQRRTPAGGRLLRAEDFRVVEFRGVAKDQHLMSVSAERPYKLTVSGDAELSRLTPQELSSQSSGLIEVPPGALVYWDSSAANGMTVTLRREEPRYSARIAAEAIVESQTLKQTYLIRCEPDTSHVSRLLVHFSRPSTAPITWSLVGETDAGLSPRRLETPDGMATGETWEVLLHRPRNIPFEIRADRAVGFDQPVAIALVSLPEAASQTGTLMIGAAGGAAIAVATQNLKSVPAKKPPPDQYPLARAMYRYDPSRDALAVVSTATGGDPPDSAWVWNCRLVSRFEAGGQASHEVVLHLENTGLSQTTVTLPEGAQLQRVRVNELDVAVPEQHDGQPRVAIPLPRGRHFPTIRLVYTTHNAPLRVWDKVRAPWPQLDLPCFGRSWGVWLPPGYAAPAEGRIWPYRLSPAPSWDERLFGAPLVRRIGRPFDVFAGEDWRQVASHVTLDNPAEHAAAQFLRAVDQIVQRLARPSSSRPATWGDLVTAYRDLADSGDRPGLPSLWLDERALREAGITSHSPLPTAGSDSREGQGSELLRGSKLAVITGPDAVLVTSSDGLALYAAEAAPTKRRHVFLLRSDRSPREVAFSGSPVTQIVAAETWITAPPPLPSPWPMPSSNAEAQVFGAGWTNYRLDASGGDVAGLWVYRPQVARSLGWALALISAGLVALLARQHVLRIPLVLAVTVAAVLLTPVDVTPITRGVFLGSLFASAYVLVRRRSRLPATSSPTESSRSFRLREQPGPATIVTPVIVAIALGVVSSSRGEDGAGERSPQSAANQVFPVLIPIVEKEEAASDYLYVPRALFNAIHRRAASASVTPRGWLIHSAAYEIALQKRENEELRLAKLAASYELEVFQVAARVGLPIGRGDIPFVEEAKLDGQPIRAQWDPDRQALMFDVERPEKHRLELLLKPPVQDDAGQFSVHMAIPRVSRSRLTVKTPEGVEKVRVAKVLGQITVDSANGELAADLGPLERLNVSWPRRPADESQSPEVDLAKLLWVKAQPGSVVIDAKFTLTIRRGSLREFQLVADPRLRMLPLAADQPVLRQVIHEGELQTIQLELDGPHDSGVTLQTSFLLTGASGIGSVRSPRLEAPAASLKQSWLGVSLAPSVELQVSQDLEANRLAAADFSALWGQGETGPQSAYRLSLDDESWTLTMRPRAARTIVDQELDIAVGSRQADLLYAARLDMSDGSYLQQRLLVPDNVEVREIAVIHEDVNRALRWSRSDPGEVTVFFNHPVSGQHRLVLHGETPAPTRGRWPLPIITVAETEVKDNRIRVYRRSDANVTLDEISGLRETPNVGYGQFRDGWGRLAASLEAAGPEAPRRVVAATATVVPNAPKVTGHLVTALSFADDRWLAGADISLRSSGGVVDLLRLNIPDELTEPFELDPPLPFQIEKVPGQNRRNILIRPPVAISRDFQVRVRGRLTASPGQRVRAPDIQVLDVDEMDRFLVVPTRLAGQQIAWETSGLQSAPPPSDFAASRHRSESIAAYQVVGPRLEATVQDVERITGAPQVHLADIYITWRADRSCLAMATFDLEPARLTDVELDVPENLRLVQVQVAGLPAIRESIGENKWRVRLGPDQLPQRMEVVCLGKLPPKQALWRAQVFPAPSLAGLPVTQTLWTIQGPLSAGIGQPVLAHIQTSSLRQEEIRRDNAARLLDLFSNVIAQSATSEFDLSRRDWARRVEMARRWITRQRWANGQRVYSAEIRGEPRHAATGVAPLVDVEDSSAVDPFTAWSRRLPQPGLATHCLARGFTPSIVVRYAGIESSQWILRAAVAAVLVGLAALAPALLRFPGLSEWLIRWPHVAGVLGGLAWWLWLSPSSLGLAIILIFLAGSLRPAWKAKRVNSL